MEAAWKNNCWQQLSFAVVGLGLIGGSFAKALRRLGVRQIIGVESNPQVLEQACQQGLVDVALSQADDRLRQANVIICAVYPEAVSSFVENSVSFFQEQVLLTDAAGIKGEMVTQVQRLLKPGMEFISGHPMAGRQGSGLTMADAEIFDGANYIIVPERHNTRQAVEWLERFALALGCRHTVEVTPQEHDGIIAFTSNLPHVLAVALMNSSSYNEKTKYFIAGSFRDCTRVADINPELWSSLFLSNKDKAADEIDRYIKQLEIWRAALRAGDGDTLRRQMRIAAERRKELY